MAETDLKELKQELISIITAHLANPGNEITKDRARKIHNRYMSAVFLQPEMQHAIGVIVSIGYDTGIETPRKIFLEILQELKNLDV